MGGISRPLAACVFDGVQEGGNFATILNIFWKANDPSAKIHGISWNGKNFILHGLPVNGNDSPQGPAACTFNSLHVQQLSRAGPGRYHRLYASDLCVLGRQQKKESDPVHEVVYR